MYKIAPRYIKEYEREKTGIVVSRLKFFCALVIGVYVALSVFALILDPQTFKADELFTWVILIAAASACLYVNRRVATLARAKLNAGAFAASVAAAITVLFFVYPDYIMQSSEMFALSVFLISFMMPWRSYEAAAIGLIHIAGYTIVFMWAAQAAPSAAQAFRTIFAEGGYFDGLIFLAVAVFICAVIKHRDNIVDRKAFMMLKEIEARNAQMKKELAIARDVHKTLIPKSTSTENASIAVSYVPLDAVGGDYATFHVTKDGGLFFLIGDVTGHGVPAALLVNRVYGEIESLISKNPDPGTLMKELDRFVNEHFRQTEMYFSVCSGLLDFKTSTLFYSNYGHPPQILHQHRDNTISLLESQTYLLGIGMEAAGHSVYEGKLRFDHKDRIVLFTDGLIESKGPDGELYGMRRLESFVKTRTTEPAQAFNTELLGEVGSYRKGPVADDIFLVTIDIK